MIVRVESVNMKPASSATICKISGAAVIWKGTVKETVATSLVEAKVCAATAPATGLHPATRRTRSVAGIGVPVLTETVAWKAAK